jgi:hypothetical protein
MRAAAVYGPHAPWNGGRNGERNAENGPTSRSPREILLSPPADNRNLRKQATSQVDNSMGLNPVDLLSSRLHSKADFLWFEL